MEQLAVFFSERMVADSGGFSPSAGKPAALVCDWVSSGFPVRLVEPFPATEAELCRVHDPAYVEGVLSGRARNGFGNRRSDVILSLPYTTGAMLTAARFALENPGEPAPCAPCSGFHHAGYGFGGGFCTFNGLMVTAAALVAGGQARRVGILDADMHYGNGTDDILRRLDREHGLYLDNGVAPTFGQRAPTSTWCQHVTVGQKYKAPHHAVAFLRYLPEVVGLMAESCDVVLYQAGADPHVDDPLGGWLTTEQLAERDRIVFEGCRAAETPVVWNLAGGYQVEADGTIPKVIEIHTNTARAALRAAGAVDRRLEEHTDEGES